MARLKRAIIARRARERSDYRRILCPLLTMAHISVQYEKKIRVLARAYMNDSPSRGTEREGEK